ncbi:hypothetical protein BGX26_008334 [Mortierella sp. AD094]|nr:hypothetical protein BGX26_008334 [Mortierella sp. AD094]
MSSMVHGDIQCQQFGADTFHVGSTIKFIWNDTGSVPIDTFTLDLYCYQTNSLMKTLATLNTTASSQSQYWTVDQTIMSTLAECPYNQYQGRFDWTYTDPNTGALAQGFAPCKSMLLVGPGVTPAPGAASPADPQPTDDNPGPVEITEKTKTIVIAVGCAVGVLVLAGIVGFYFIRYKNKRAERDSANNKLREPLSRPSEEGDGFGGNQDGAAARHDGLTGITTSNSGYAPVSKSELVESEMVEMGGAHPTLYTQSYSNTRPASLLTSPFTPPEDDSRAMQDREQHRQQYEQQMLHQQQLQHQQQQQQQQLSYGGYYEVMVVQPPFLFFRFSASPHSILCTHSLAARQMQGAIPPLTPIPPSSTFIHPTATFAPLSKRGTQKPTSLSFSYSSTSSTITPSAYNPPSTNPNDHELERQRHLRQNQEIIRLCALKSTQIRQSETKLSQLESENLELRTALRKVEQQLGAKSVVQPINFSTPPSHSSISATSLERLRLNLRSGDRSKCETSLEQHLQKQSEGTGSESNRENGSDRIQHEPCVGNFGEEDEALRIKRQLAQVVSGTLSISKRSLISKLNQIQVIYQREHEALCAMMSTFNSTTRLYKDVICLLEREATEPSEKLETHNHGEFSASDSISFPRSPYIYSNSWFETTTITPPSSFDAVGEHRAGYPPGQSNLFSLSSTISPERNQTQKSPRRRTVAQISLSPEFSHDFSAIHMGSSTNEQDSNQSRQKAASMKWSTSSISTGESAGLEMNLGRGNIAPKPRPYLTRPISHSLPKINTLPSIDEQDSIDTQSLSPPWQQEPLSPSYSHPQQPDSDLQRPRPEDQQAQGAAMRGLKRSLAIRAPISPRRGMSSPYKCRRDVPLPHDAALTPKSKHSKGERVSVINLPNFSSTEHTSETPAPSLDSGPLTSSATGSAADDFTDDVFVFSREIGDSSANAGDSDASGRYNRPHVDTESSSDRSRNKRIPRSNTNDITTKNNITVGSGNISNTGEHSIFTNSLRAAAPSPMIKSRSTIASERVKYLTPKWVSRRTSKVPLRNPRLPDLPSASVKNATMSVHKHQASLVPASSFGFPSTSHHGLSLPVLKESQNSSSIEPEADQSSILMPPPPLPPRPPRLPKTPKQDRARRKHRKRHHMAALIPTSRSRNDQSQFIVGERRNWQDLQRDQGNTPVTSAPDFKGSRLSRDNINNIDNNHHDRATGRGLALGIDESSLRSKSRPGKGAIVYRLPSIRK